MENVEKAVFIFVWDIENQEVLEILNTHTFVVVCAENFKNWGTMHLQSWSETDSGIFSGRFSWISSFESEFL